MNVGVLQFSLVFLIIGGLLIAVLKKLKLVLSANGKKGLYYLLVAVCLFAVGGFLSKESLFSGNLTVNYTMVQVFFFILGILHLIAMNAFLKWEEDVKKSSEAIFTIMVAFFGALIFVNAAAYIGVEGFHLFFLSGALLFFVPSLIYGLWNVLVSFPVPVYQKWYYPVSRSVSLPDTDELKNLRIVSLEFSKNVNGAKTVFKAKAPENMNFGKFFYHFINDYNHRSPEAPIAYKDEAHKPYGWYFYIKPNLIGSTRNVNPELTTHANGLREHITIICERVI